MPLWHFLLMWLFQSTHPVRDVTSFGPATRSRLSISIHTSREGCDGSLCPTLFPDTIISIHTSREGCDFVVFIEHMFYNKFQSTHPVRDVTLALEIGRALLHNFNPHIP